MAKLQFDVEKNTKGEHFLKIYLFSNKQNVNNLLKGKEAIIPISRYLSEEEYVKQVQLELIKVTLAVNESFEDNIDIDEVLKAGSEMAYRTWVDQLIKIRDYDAELG